MRMLGGHKQAVTGPWRPIWALCEWVPQNHRPTPHHFPGCLHALAAGSWCIQSIYDATVTAPGSGEQPQAVGPSYHTYSQGATQYTTAKLRVQLPLASTAGTQVCFSLRAGICPSLQRLCAGSSCMFALAQDITARNTCCPVATSRFW